MSNKYVIDASVYAKLILQEEDSWIAEKLFKKIIQEGSYILVPSIFIYEITGILRKYNHDKEIIKEFTKKYYFNKKYIKVFSMDEEILSKALDMCQTGNTKTHMPYFYDTSYHAIAILNNCDFITADGVHYGKTESYGHIKLLTDFA